MKKLRTTKWRIIAKKRYYISEAKKLPEKLKKYYRDHIQNELRNIKAELKQKLAIGYLYLTIATYKLSIKILDKIALLTNHISFYTGKLSEEIAERLYEITTE